MRGRPKKTETPEKDEFTAISEGFDMESDEYVIPQKNTDISKAVEQTLDYEKEEVEMYVPEDGGTYAWRYNKNGTKDKVIQVVINGEETLVPIGQMVKIPFNVAEVLKARVNRHQNNEVHQQFNSLGVAK